MLDSIPREADAEHGVEDGFVGDAITDKKDLAVKTCLQDIDVLPYQSDSESFNFIAALDLVELPHLLHSGQHDLLLKYFLKSEMI